MATPEENLEALGITLPAPPAAVAAYVPTVRSGDLVYVSGQIPMVDGAITVTGKVGGTVPVEAAVEAARTCAVNVVAQLKGALGDLSRVVRVVKVTGFVASDPGFSGQPEVINGASELLAAVFGEAGRHARSAVGVASLPRDVPVEVEAIVEVS